MRMTVNFDREHFKIGLVNAVVKYRTTAWQTFEEKEKGILGRRETRGRGVGGGWVEIYHGLDTVEINIMADLSVII